MPRIEIDAEISKKLDYLKARHLMPGGGGFKNIDWKEDPKFFQVGTMKDGPILGNDASLGNKFVDQDNSNLEFDYVQVEKYLIQ